VNEFEKFGLGHTSHEPVLRVALVSKFPPSSGGESEYFYNLAKSVSNISHAVAVANLEQRAKTLESSGRLRMLRVWQTNHLSYPFRILKACVGLRPNLIHLNHEYLLYGRPAYGALFPFLLILLRLTRAPVVVTMHSVIPREALAKDFFKRYSWQRFSALKSLLLYAWTKLILILATHIIVLSEASRNCLVRQYGCPSGKISTVAHGVSNLPLLSKQQARHLLDLEDRPIILNVGFLHEKKGIEYLVRAMSTVLKENPKALLVVAGGPHASYAGNIRFQEYVARLRQLVSSLDIRDSVILRTQTVPVELVPIYLASADVVVLPYLEHFGASGVLAHAIAAGKPVVATRVNPFFESLQDGVNALLVNPGNENELAGAILKLINDSGFGEYLAKNLRNSAANLGWGNVANLHLKIYSDLAKGSNGLGV